MLYAYGAARASDRTVPSPVAGPAGRGAVAAHWKCAPPRFYGLLPVDIATVAGADHLYEQPVVVDLVDDPVVTDVYSAHICFRPPERRISVAAVRRQAGR